MSRYLPLFGTWLIDLALICGWYRPVPLAPRKFFAALARDLNVVERLVSCKLTSYNGNMIKSFRHKGIGLFFETGPKAGIQPSHAARLRLQLTRLGSAVCPNDMGASGWKLHRLAGELADHWAVTVSGNWRLTFSFDGQDVVLVDYQDYH